MTSGRSSAQEHILRSFFGKTRTELADVCQSVGSPGIHAATLMTNAYKKLESSPWTSGQLPKKLQALVSAEWEPHQMKIEKVLPSEYDGSVKFLVALKDGKHIEVVLMPEARRITLCISSQVGCNQACSFCYTGRMGLIRQLEASEMVLQVVLANRWIKENPDWLDRNRLPASQKVTHIVLMGMGEPLDNVNNLIQAIKILTEPRGLDFSPKRISVSTAGHLDGLKELTKAFPKIAIAFSLHAIDGKVRNRLMPINRRWPFQDVLEFLKQHFETHQPKGWFLIQYTLISKVNDDLEQAKSLATLLKDLPVKVNLIPLNYIDVSSFTSPEPDRLHQFRDVIHNAGIRVMIRYSKGQDISAACGQLVISNK